MPAFSFPELLSLKCHYEAVGPRMIILWTAVNFQTRVNEKIPVLTNLHVNGPTQIAQKRTS